MLELNPKKSLEWVHEDFGHFADLDSLLANFLQHLALADMDHLVSFFKYILYVQSPPFYQQQHYKNEMYELGQKVELKKKTTLHLNSPPEKMSYPKKRRE